MWFKRLYCMPAVPYKSVKPPTTNNHVDLSSKKDPIEKRDTGAGVRLCFSRLRLPLSFFSITCMELHRTTRWSSGRQLVPDMV
jgi:hypothetical protein